jgi:hypothetical protein
MGELSGRFAPNLRTHGPGQATGRHHPFDVKQFFANFLAMAPDRRVAVVVVEDRADRREL